MNGIILFGLFQFISRFLPKPRFFPIFQLLASGAIVRDRQLNQRPESRRMVELSEMTELVHDEIVGEMRRQERELVAEVEVAIARAAPPAGALVADAYAVVGEDMRRRQGRVEAGKMLEPGVCESTGGFFVQGEGAAAGERGWTARANTPTNSSHDTDPSILKYDLEKSHAVMAFIMTSCLE